MRQPSWLIIDAHEDIAYNALQWGRDVRHSALETRAKEAREHPDYQNPDAAGGIIMSGLPELRRAGFGIVFSTLFAYPKKAASQEVSSRYTQTQTYSTINEAHDVAERQLSYYRDIAKEPGISIISTRTDLSRFLDDWRQISPKEEQRLVGIVILMEGADPIRIPDEAEQWFIDGVRIIGPSWNIGTQYAGGNVSSGPLTFIGRELLSVMERLGIALDTTHMAEESFWQALEFFQGNVIASHSNCRAIVPSTRHLSDDMIRALAEHNGVIGISPFNSFLVAGWSRTQRSPVTLEQVVAHIDHICQLLGNAYHVGIGSDIDGGFGRDETPTELDTIADLSQLGQALRRTGYSKEDIKNIMGGNWLRFLERTLPKERG